MFEFTVTGQFKFIEAGRKALKSYTETFVLAEKDFAMNRIQNELLEPRLREKYPEYCSWRTCSLVSCKKAPEKGAVLAAKSISDLSKLSKDELKKFCLYAGIPANLGKAKDDNEARQIVKAAMAKHKKDLLKQQNNEDDEVPQDATAPASPIDGL